MGMSRFSTPSGSSSRRVPLQTSCHRYWSTPTLWPHSIRAISRSQNAFAQITWSMISVAPERPVAPIALDVLTVVDRVARSLGFDYFVTGAMARDILLGKDATRIITPSTRAQVVALLDDARRLREP